MNLENLTKSIHRIAFAHVVLHLNINLGTLNILPDWLGYAMILSGLNDLAEEEPSAALLRPLGKLLLWWWGAMWIFQLLDTEVDGGGFVYIVSVIRLYFQFQLLTNIAAIAVKYAPDCEGRILRLRTVMTLVVTGYTLVSAVTVHVAITAVTAVVYCVSAVWLCRELMELSNRLELVLARERRVERELTFAERIQMNMENAEG